MPRRDLVVIGGSAGGIEALRALVSELPADFPAAILVVIHIAASAVSVLPAILMRAGKLPAHHPKHGDRIENGHIYCAPPDHHLLVRAHRICITRGPRVNNHRPAIDPLFMTAARWMGQDSISVLLSGVLDDGTNGSLAVRVRGGVTVAQSPEDALYGAMPLNAIENAGVDHILPAKDIAALLVKLVSEDSGETPIGSDGNGSDGDGGRRRQGGEDDAAMSSGIIENELDFDPEGSADVTKPASGFTCPDCHGALWEVAEEQLVRFRCRVGHSYAPESLHAAQSEKLEEAIWAGYRALEESAQLSKRLAQNAAARGLTTLAERYQSRYDDAIERAKVLRKVLERGQFATTREVARS